tara:strand:- start:7300 stop:8364 length:1065 start_codon:yes stop_codon:yes gene_type:complete
MEKANTHMEHFEDLLFEKPDLLVRMMHHEVKFTRKWDGAPSIFFGVDDDGSPWIARKGLFNKDAKKYYKRSDFDADEKFPEDLKIPLWNTLVYLGRAWAGPESDKYFVQGDLMFTDGPDNGHFHPNTIQYFSMKIPKKARVGIVWHTRYVDNRDLPYPDGGPDELWIEYGSSVKEHFKLMDELWMINAHDEIEDFVPNFGMVPVVGNYAHLSSKTKDLFKMYQNAVVKGHANNLMDYLFVKMTMEVESVKQDNTKHRKILSYKPVFEELAANPNLEKDYAKMQDYKMMLLKQFNDLPTDYVPQLVRKGFVTGPESTDHEGYAVFDRYGNAAKLVDRKRFSAANFSDEYVKGWSK